MGLDNYPLLEAVIDASAAGDNVIVAGVPGRTIRVFRLFFVVGGDTIITIKDGAAIVFTGPMFLTTGGSVVLDFTDQHWFATHDGNNFVIESANAVEIAGRIYYTMSSP